MKETRPTVPKFADKIFKECNYLQQQFCTTSDRLDI